MFIPDVLIVDDNDCLAGAYDLLLADLGFRVNTARSGREALGFCTDTHRDLALAIIDLKMPDLDGPDTILALRGNLPALQIIAISGQMLSPYFARLADLGVRHFLPKPFSVDSLVAEIREVLPTPA